MEFGHSIWSRGVGKFDDQGLRQTWVVRDDDTLAARWASITTEYGAFYEQREAYE
jgi:hypothetical protein